MNDCALCMVPFADTWLVICRGVDDASHRSPPNLLRLGFEYAAFSAWMACNALV
jgi:hypothetical protein